MSFFWNQPHVTLLVPIFWLVQAARANLGLVCRHSSTTPKSWGSEQRTTPLRVQHSFVGGMSRRAVAPLAVVAPDRCR